MKKTIIRLLAFNRDAGINLRQNPLKYEPNNKSQSIGCTWMKRLKCGTVMTIIAIRAAHSQFIFKTSALK